MCFIHLLGLVLLLSLMIHSGYGFDCPTIESNEDCELMEFCSVCNNQGNAMFPDFNSCSQCDSSYFLYGVNQCLQCQDTFGNECLHCSDGQGCQQCAGGYQRVKDEDCGVHYCELIPEPEACDENCRSCQNLNNPANAYCSQCSSGYFLGDNTGLNGCLSCSEEYGDSCMFCANLQGCQQCIQGFNRVKNDVTGLHYCECAYDCSVIISFEELAANFTGSLYFTFNFDGYYDLKWSTNSASAAFLTLPNSVFAGVALLADDIDTYGLVGYVCFGPFYIGESGGAQFKVIEFVATTTDADITMDVICKGYLNNNEQFSTTHTIIENQLNTILINNNIIIDQLECTSSVDDIEIVIDNIELVFV